jgi:hypothetical protein
MKDSISEDLRNRAMRIGIKDSPDKKLLLYTADHIDALEKLLEVRAKGFSSLKFVTSCIAAGLMVMSSIVPIIGIQQPSYTLGNNWVWYSFLIFFAAAYGIISLLENIMGSVMKRFFECKAKSK